MLHFVLFFHKCIRLASDAPPMRLRLYPTLCREVLLWEDYCRLIETNRHKKYHAVKNSARYDVCEMYGICEKTFFAIRSELKDLCEDVE